MTRRLHRCLTCELQQPTREAPLTLCRGLTRHRDRICAERRAGGVVRVGDEVFVPFAIDWPGRRRLIVVPRVADPARPTLTELAAGLDVSGFLAGTSRLGRSG